MKIQMLVFVALLHTFVGFSQKPSDNNVQDAILKTDSILYHPVRINTSDGSLLPWYSADLGKSYDFVITKVWNFWDTMRMDMNGLPYYMNHQVWKPEVNDTRGVAGSQFEMALNSWRLLYQYSGDERLKENSKFMVDYYISHSLSPASAKWPHLPYPYNTLSYSGIYDGDMVIGRNYTQPDKAGSFGNELIQLYKLIGFGSHGQTPTGIYMETAINIANTLSKHIIAGNDSISPLPFKVNAVVGKYGKVITTEGTKKPAELYNYTSNWSGTMELFLELIQMKKGNTKEYKKSFDILLTWMKKYPLQNNRWGPFFEDIVGASETQINAVTFAQFIMNHQEYFPNWKKDVKGIFDWVYKNLGNNEWEKYGVTVVNEQTAFIVPGNSHTSRQASAELQYAELTGDTSYVKNAVLALNWATYMVDYDGVNRYPRDDIWLSDGYGDYVRHYLRAMSAMPELSPADMNKLIFSSSVVQKIDYKDHQISFTSFDNSSKVTLRLISIPQSIKVNDKSLERKNVLENNTWTWMPMEKGGVLKLNYTGGNKVVVKL